MTSRGVLVIAHGSEEPGDCPSAEVHSASVAERLGIPCYYGYLERQEPILQVTLNRMISDGIEEAAVVPLFFARSFFSEHVVPKLVGLPKGSRHGTISRNPGTMRVSVSGALGDHPLMSRVMDEASEGLDPRMTAILLIGHGSMDGTSLSAVEGCADMLRSKGFETRSCFLEMQAPSIEEGLGDALSLGFGHVHVIPMFISSSPHTSSEIPDALGLPEGCSERVADGVRITYGPEIGGLRSVADIVASRAEEAFSSFDH